MLLVYLIIKIIIIIVNKYLLTFDSFSVIPSSEADGTIYFTGTCDAPNGVCDTEAICLYLTENFYTELAADLVPTPCKRTCLDCVITLTKKRSSNQANQASLDIEFSVKKAYQGDGRLNEGSMLFNFFFSLFYFHFLLPSLLSTLLFIFFLTSYSSRFISNCCFFNNEFDDILCYVILI
jgi:hypothetical protein